MLSYLHAIVNKGLGDSRNIRKTFASLGTAHAKDCSLDKKQPSYDDLLDAMRLTLKGYKTEQKSTEAIKDRSLPDFFHISVSNFQILLALFR